MLVKEYRARDQVHTAAMIDDMERNVRLVNDLTEQLKAYDEERRRRKAELARQTTPGYIGADEPRIIYPSQRKRPGDRKTRELRVSRKDRTRQADQLEELAPIRLDLELDKLRLRDTFTWNIHDRVIPPELFAQNLVEDFRIPPEELQPMIQLVYQAMQEQISDFHPHIFIEEQALDPHLPYSAYKNDEMRVLIKLNITIGQHTLVDQFDWDINSPLNSPEEFARQMGRDLSLSGEFMTAISHSIREQAQLFTKSLYVSAHPFDGRPVDDADIRDSLLPSPLPSVFRPYQLAKDFTPVLYELSDADLERTELAFSREQRQQKRSVNRRGGPSLPDLKDRPKTWRTMLVSAVIPGCVDALADTGLVRAAPRAPAGAAGAAGAVGARPRRSARADAATASSMADSSSDDSDSSTSDSPGPTAAHLLHGTARTRGIRGAASAAAAAMRAAAAAASARSPPAAADLPFAHHHETRPRRAAGPAGYDTREQSPGADGSLVVRLRVGRDRLRRWMRARQLGRPMGPSGGGGGGGGGYSAQQLQGSAQGYGGMDALDGAGLSSSTPGFAQRQHQPQQYGRPASPPHSRFGSHAYSDGVDVSMDASFPHSQPQHHSSEVRSFVPAPPARALLSPA